MAERNAEGKFILKKKLGGFVMIPGNYVRPSPVIDLATCFRGGSFQFSQSDSFSIYIEDSYNGEIQFPENNFSIPCV